MSQLGSIIIAVILSIVVVAPLSWSLAIAHRKKSYEDKIGSAEIKSREIIEEALKTAETKKREALLEAKEESIKTKNELDREVKERRAELARYEKRVLSLITCESGYFLKLGDSLIIQGFNFLAPCQYLLLSCKNTLFFLFK